MDILESITDGLENWSIAISDTERFWNEVEDLRYNVECNLYRQQCYGLMNESDVVEMRNISDKWSRLLHSISMYNIGYVYLRGEIITLLIDLFLVNQIDKPLLIECLTTL